MCRKNKEYAEEMFNFNNAWRLWNKVILINQRRWTWTGDFKCREVKTGFYRNRSMQTGSSGTLIGWKSGQTTFVPLWDWMEGARLRTQGATKRCRLSWLADKKRPRVCMSPNAAGRGGGGLRGLSQCSTAVHMEPDFLRCGSSPTLPSESSTGDTQEDRERETTCWTEKRKVEGKEPDQTTAWSSINHSVLSVKGAQVWDIRLRVFCTNQTYMDRWLRN